jgi:hypothetical protein
MFELSWELFLGIYIGCGIFFAITNFIKRENANIITTIFFSVLLIPLWLPVFALLLWIVFFGPDLD